MARVCRSATVLMMSLVGCEIYLGDSGETGLSAGSAWYLDEDGDHFGAASAEAVYAVDAPEGYAATADDCDDRDAAVYPGAAEYCNERDDDCDGSVDEEPADGVTSYPDGDGDGYGAELDVRLVCEVSDGSVLTGGDCDDGDAAINPAADELCNDVDDDCDGDTDDEPIEGDRFYADLDKDGYGDPDSSGTQCRASEDWLEDAEDCDDTSDSIHPGATERCNRIDDDCDGFIDEVFDADEDVETLCDLWDREGLGDADVKVVGAFEDLLGDCVIFAGDLDGDLDDDLLLGASNSFRWEGKAGAVFVVAGAPAESGSIDDLGVATMLGEAVSANAGSALSAAGDVNLDGFGDIWVQATTDTSADNEGAAVLFLGPVSGTLMLSEADLRWLGDEDTNGLKGMGAGGDFDGDGTRDLVLGAMGADTGGGSSSGQAWIALADGGWGDRWLPDASILLLSERTDDKVGTESALVGDTTGDGTDDVVVTGYGERTTDDAGLSWVIEDPLSEGSYVIDDVASTVLEGEDAGDVAGDELGQVGDMNGDGYADFAIGAQMESSAAFAAGAVYVVYGPAGSRSSLTDADVKLSGANAWEKAMNIGGSGDVDADGWLDLAVGAAYLGTTEPAYSGRVFLLRGPLDGGTTSLEDADLILDGESPSDNAGLSLDLSGDANADGYADLLVGAYRHELGEDSANGAAYLVFGQPY